MFYLKIPSSVATKHLGSIPMFCLKISDLSLMSRRVVKKYQICRYKHEWKCPDVLLKNAWFCHYKHGWKCSNIVLKNTQSDVASMDGNVTTCH